MKFFGRACAWIACLGLLSLAPVAGAQTVSNTATITAPPGVVDPAPGNNSATVTAPVWAATVAKSSDPASGATVPRGQEITYTLTWTVSGAATTAPTIATDTLSAGQTFVPASWPAGCSAAGQVLSCTLPAGTAVGTHTYAYRATVDADATGTIGNAVTGPACAPAGACATTHPVGIPELTLAKTASAPSFTVGVAASYTLTVQNTGNAATSAAATVSDPIPAGLAIGALPAGCTAAGQNLSCTIPAGLAVGASASFTIPVTPMAPAVPGVTNTAAVSGGGDTDCPAAVRCTSTVTTPVQSTIDASDDSFGVPSGASGGTTPSVIVNDSTNGTPAVIGTNVTLTPGTSPNPGLTMNPDGTVTVAPGTPAGSYTYPYTICTLPATTPATCDTANAVVTVGAAPIDAVNDTGSVANGALGGVAVLDVLVNDTLNGNPATLGNVTLSQVSTSHPGVTLDPATGAVNVAPGTPAGSYTLDYRICEQLNPSNCDTATVTVSVAASAVIDAVDDNYTAAPLNGGDGGTTPSVIANDITNGTPVVVGTNATLTPGTSPNPGLTMNPDGTITVAPGTPAGNYSYPYTICTLPATTPATCDTATATVAVTAPTIDAVDDSASTTAGSPVTTPVLGNDTHVGGAIDPGSVTVTAPSPNGSTTVDPATGAVTFTPNPGFSGTTSYTYQVCLAAPNASVCDTAVVNVTVGATVDAVDDALGSFNGGDGGTTASVIANDVVNGTPAVIGTNATLTPGTSPNPGLTMNPDGTITVAPGTPAGSYSYPYTLCAAAAPAVCDTATATVVVTAPTIDAVNDTATTTANTPVTTPVLGNDTHVGGTIDPGSVAVTSPSPNGTTTVDPATGAITFTPSPGFSGTTSYTYQVCLAAPNASVCDTAVVGVTVGATIDATDDVFNVANGASGGTTSSVIVNDSTNGTPAVIGTNVTLTPGTAPTLPSGGLTMNPDGTITVAPATPTGSYSYPYTICTLPATTPATCDTATATVVVGVPPIDAVNDTGSVANGALGGVAVPDVLVNDTLNGNPATLGNVTLSQESTSHPGVTLDPATGAVNVAPGTPAGSYTLDYRICEQLNPSNCDTATVTVSVAASAVIDAVDDNYASAPVNGGDGGTTASVIANDTTNGTPAVIGTNVTLTPGTSPNPGLTMNPDGTITVAPGTPAGSYTYPYTICTLPATTPATCDTATATVVVAAPTIDAANDTATTTAGTPVTTPVLGNDTHVGGTIDPASVTVTTPSPNGTTTVDPTTGAITFTPNPGFSGSTSYTYQVCLAAPNAIVCDTAVVNVTVGATIDAVDDNYAGAPLNGGDGGTTPSVVANDTTNGTPAVVGTNVTLTPGASPNPGLTMNPDGTITVAPGTPAGSYSYPYTICTLPATTPATCDTASATVAVTAPTIDAGNDVATTTAGTPVTTPVLGNDTHVGGTIDPASVTVTTPSPNGATTVDPTTGAITFTPNPGFSGPTSYTYQVCLAAPNASVCDTAVVNVTVGATIDATDDAFNVANGASGGTTPSVIVNDVTNGTPAVIGANASLTPGTSPNPGLTMNPDGTITVAPGTPAGSYTYPYTICTLPATTPATCDTANAVVTVGAAPIDAVNDTGSVANGALGGVAVPDVLVNDTLNGNPATLGNVTLSQVSTSHPGVTLDPATGAVNVAPGTPAGSYTLDYRICEQLNPGNCDTATVTVSVAASAVIDAVDDNYTATPINGGSGGSTPVVSVNDTVNGAPAVIGSNVTLNPGAPSPMPGAGGITMDANGVITVEPGTPAGTYTYGYQICALPATSPPTCDTATATVLVVAPTIDAANDTATTTAGTPVTTPVLGNDTHVGGTIDPGSVAVTSPSPDGTTTVDPATGAITFTPNPGFSGPTSYTYQVCLAAPNASVCDTAVANVTVGATVDAVDDALGSFNGGDGGTTASVIANDVVNGTPAVIGTNATLTPGASPNPGLTMNPDGTITVAPGTPAGSYSYPYTLCAAAAPTVCDTATATVVVDAPTIAAQPDTADTSANTPVTTPVLGNDSHVGGTIDPGSVTVTAPSPDGTTTVDPATGAITFTPDPGFTGSTDYTYQVCLAAPNQAVCSTAVVTVNVGRVEVRKALTGESGSQPGLAEAGEQLRYTITVANSGGAEVANYALVDVLGPGLSFVSASHGGAASGQTTTWTGLTIPANGSLSVELVARVNRPVDSDSVRNLARAANEPDPSCPGIACVEIPTAAYVTPQKLLTGEAGGVEPGLAEFGETLNYTIALTNTGGTAFRHYRFTEHVPAGATLTGVSGAAGFSGPVAGPATVALTVAEVPARGTATVGVSFRVAEAPPAGLAEIVNLIDGGDIDPACGAACTVRTPLEQPTQLSLVKSAAVREARIGDLVRYTVRVVNVGSADVVDGRIVDTPPQGFTYVAGSMAVADRDNAFVLGPAQYPLTIDGIDVPVGQEAVITYMLRVGAGVRHGVHANQARALDRHGRTASNIASAQVTVVADPLLDESLILGTVFDDRDGDGWQDPASLTGVRVQGGFAPGAYVAGSTAVDRGQGPQPEPDASAPLLHGIALGRIEGRQSEADLPENHQVVIRQRLSALDFTDDFVLTSAQGVTLRMDAAGHTRIEKSGDAAKGLNGAEPSVTRTVAQSEGGYVVDYVIRNLGIDERGIPGVRIASVEGLLIETDPYGRYHLLGIEGGKEAFGRNFVLKVDPSTLPAGAEFTTANPLLRRITPGLPVRFDFGVRLPVERIGGTTADADIVLGELLFAPGKAALEPAHEAAIERIAAKVDEFGGQGELVIAADGETQGLALARATAVRGAVLPRLQPASAQALRVVVRTEVNDPGSLLVGQAQGATLLGTVLFDTDRAVVKPAFGPLLRQIARQLEAAGGGLVRIVGHADRRAGAAHNEALGMRRARAVYDALARELSPDVRAKVRVDVQGTALGPTPAAMKEGR